MQSPDSSKDISRHDRTVRDRSGGHFRDAADPRHCGACPACGAPLEPDARFCGECGEPVARAPADGTRRLSAAPHGTFDEEDDLRRMAAYRRKLTDDPAGGSAVHAAERPPGAVGWVCNANGYLHPSPAQCRNADRGGRWVTEWEGITRPEDIPWDTIEE